MKLSYTWWQAALFAICYDLLLILSGWLLIGPPATTDSFATLKVTATIGVPTVSQLLDAKHQTMLTQASSINLFSLLVAVGLMLVFALANTYYLGLLSRSLRDLPGTLGADVRKGWVSMLLWLLLQFVLGIIVMLPLMMLGTIGGLLSVVLLLWFRYYFLFFEYVIVVLNRPFAEAWKVAPLYLKETNGQMVGIFVGILIVNVILAYLINAMFSLPTLIFFIVLNAFIHSKIQEHVLRRFFEVDDAVTV